MVVLSGGSDGEDAALAAIVRSSQDAVIAKTVDGLITAWNQGATQVYGFTRAEMLGRDIAVLFPADAAEDEAARHARVAAGAAESGYRCRRVRSDGREVEVVMSMLPVRDAAGRITGLASISRPVSEEERAHEQFAALLDAAPDAIVGLDDAGRVVVHNRRAPALFGRDDLQGVPVEELLPGLHSHPPAAGEGAGEAVSMRGHRPDGSVFPVEVSLSRTPDRPGTALIAIVRDVTRQRSVEAQLRESATRLRQLADNVTTVFTLRQLDPPAYLYVSPGITPLTGYRPEDLYADPTLALGGMIHPDDRAEAVRRRSAGDLGEGSLVEQRIIRTDGTVRWVRASSVPVPNPHGEPERVVGMAEDVTERVEAQQRLQAAEAEARAANEAKNAFLSRVSHELRTPLNAVLGFGQLLERKLAGTADEDAVHHVVQGGRHLLSLIDDVLDISRIEAGQMSVSLEPVALHEVAAETLRLMEPIAATAGVRLVPPEAATAHVRADGQRLRQVLLNLVSNAVKYNRPGGTVVVRCEVDGDEVRLDVVDDGPGIPAEVEHRLFTPFDRLGAEGTSVEGTGVGLALSRALVELMDGRLAHHAHEGGGAVFTVRLPVARPHAEPAADLAPVAVAAPPTTPGHSCTLLYVEDNTANVEVMQAVLGLRPEWAFVHAGLGGLALDLARAHRPDLVLLDLHLPDGSGVDVLRSLRRDPATADTRVVVLSADASPSTIAGVLGEGADAYLAKPYELDRLLEVLDDAAAAAAGRRADAAG
ncbi:PAS domain S-box-containing protein [Nocardioides scoriae]|uniref:histidine kinase n=1 Tax=Nocardioides scoriae TaxID=642780 RepID=A0A1H1M5F5_9ACTN|nr:PAS domain S-box protein [Nocardioides scoriae]SDR81897.1 PAS domain S-box-containing protein [Nocardioides scoriae]